QNQETHQVKFESDDEVVVNRVNQGVEDHSEFGSIIHEIQEQLEGFRDFSVVFARRECNIVAQALARRFLLCAEPVIGDAPPRWLLVALANFCAVTH
ncbi:hypothetical protein LINPERPRIM_LOCUS26890, partial [Linum perenne]